MADLALTPPGFVEHVARDENWDALLRRRWEERERQLRQAGVTDLHLVEDKPRRLEAFRRDDYGLQHLATERIESGGWPVADALARLTERLRNTEASS